MLKNAIEKFSKMKKNEFHLCYATDKGYLMPTLVSATSALAWASYRDDVVVDILDCGIGDNEWRWFCDKMHKDIAGRYRILRHRIDINSYADLPSWHGSLGLYARFELPQLLPGVDWCVYADGDTLFTADPFELLEFCTGEAWLLGHEDMYSKDQEEWHKRHHVEWDGAHRVCSGFICINLRAFRENGVCDRLFEFVKKFPDVRFPDQDALNFVCRGNIKFLPSGWGCFAYVCDDQCPLKCIHYTTDKPWKCLDSKSLFPILSVGDLWYRYAKRLNHIKPWEYSEFSMLDFARCKLKTEFFVFFFKTLNFVLCGSKRFDLHRLWARRKYETLFPAADIG